MTLADDLVQVWAEDESGGVRGPMSLTALKALVDKGEVPQPFLYSYDGVTFEPAPEDLLIDLAVAESPAPEDFLVDDTIAETAHSPKPAAAAPPRSPPDGAPAKPAGPPPPPTPRAIQAAPPKGRMEQISSLRLYYLIAAADAGGLLSLGEGPSEVKLWFKQGTPHAVQSSSQQLGPFLVEQRAVSPEAFKQAQAKSPADPILFLFTSGQLNPASVFPLVQQHSLAILQHALLLDHGPFTFDPSQPAPASGFPLGNRWEILVGAARRMDPLSLRKRLSGREKQAPRLTGSTADLKLAALELRLVSALDGRRALAELATGSAAEVETQQRMIVLLHELDRLTWEAASPQKPATTVAGSAKPAVAPPAATAKPAAGAPAAAAKPVTPAAGARPTAAAPAGAKPAGAAPAKPVAPKPAATPAAPAKPAAGPPAKKPDDPAKFLASLKDKNYFERLGLPKSDKAPPTLKATYLQFAKIYHPDMVASDAPPEEKKQRQDIQALLNEAYSVLSDDKRLKDYLDELATKEAGLDAAALEGILKAEEDFTRAIILIKGNKVREGLTMVEQCIKLNPKEGEFYAWRGYANFLYSTNKKAAFLGAIRDVEKCQQMSPRCVPAYLIEGNMAKLIGDDARAKKAFQKVVDLDPKNIDATRELRLYQSRKK